MHLFSLQKNDAVLFVERRGCFYMELSDGWDTDSRTQNCPQKGAEASGSNSFCISTRRSQDNLESSFRLTFRSFRVIYATGLQEITTGASCPSTAFTSRTVPQFPLLRQRKTTLVSSTENLHPCKFLFLGCEVNLLCLFQEANLKLSLRQLESFSSGRSYRRMHS